MTDIRDDPTRPRPDEERPTPQPTPAPAVNITVHNTVDANAHVWRVAGTILAVGALVSLAWGLAEAGLLELAATGTTAFLGMFLQLLLRGGMIVLPTRRSEDARIEEGRSALRSIVGMVQAWIDQSSILRRALIAMAYATAFVLVRAGVATALTVFSNPFIAGAAGALIAAVICAPTLFVGLFRALKAKTTGVAR